MFKRCAATAFLVFAVLMCLLGENAEAATGAYEITTETYAKNNVQIRYPQIIDLGDSEKQQIINNIIRTRIGSPDYLEQETLTMKMDCEITWQSRNLLSIRYNGYYYFKGMPHPNNEFYTTNFDMQFGSSIDLVDIVVIDEEFVKKVRGGVFVVSSLHAVDPKYKSYVDYSDAKFLDYLKRLSSVYFTEDSLGISIPVVRPLGDFVIFEVKYTDIASHIRYENRVWEDFFPETGRKQ